MKQLSKDQLKAVAGGVTYFPGTKIAKARMTPAQWNAALEKKIRQSEMPVR